jgi:hypothetical protein
MTVTYFPVQEIQVADESSFCELLQTVDYSIPVTEVRVGEYTSGRASDMSRQNRMAKARPGYLMPRSGGSIELDIDLCGANQDTATGALPSTHWLYKLLKDGLGGGNDSEVGGLAGAAATATSMAAVTGTGLRGGIRRVGQKKDGRADGQAAVMGNPTTDMITALPAAPNAGDVVRACLMAYFAEVPGTTKRFIVAHNSTLNPGAQYGFHGCQLENITIKSAMGAVTVLTLRYRYAFWRELSGFTMPSATTPESCNAHVMAGGSVFFQARGTATRLLIAAHEWTLTLNMGLVPLPGQGGVDGLQSITGWARTRTSEFLATLAMTVEFDTAWTTAFDSDGSDANHYHCLHTLSAGEGTAATEGRHAAIYLPDVFQIGPRPTIRNWNDVTMMDLMFGCVEGPDTTNDLTRSVFRIGLS